MEATLSSVFKLPRIFGLFPFDSTFQWSKKWLAYCIFIQSLNIPSMINGFFNQYYLLTFDSRIRAMNVYMVISWITNFLFFFSNVFTVIYLTRKKEMVFQLFNGINNEILECPNFPKTRFYGIYLYFIFFTALVIGWSYSVDDSFKLKTMCISLMSLLLSTSKISITGQIWDLMRVLTILLRETAKGHDEGSIVALVRISAYGETVNEIYGPFLSIIVIAPFFQLISLLYLVLLPAFPQMLLINIILLFSILLCLARLGTIIYSCNKFLDQIQWFNDKLHWKILNDKTGRYSNNEMFFFHFIAYKKTKFSACGFFDIDYTLIGTMISVCTTYLVIVLQYGQGSQS
ncbi:Gustatory receptor 104d [Halyomorpha halys]|nr:Gustatory receptor 104d [Halyomorpha halys]